MNKREIKEKNNRIAIMTATLRKIKQDGRYSINIRENRTAAKRRDGVDGEEEA